MEKLQLKDLNIAHENINATCCFFNMRKAMQAITKHFNKYLKKSGITIQQFSLLVQVSYGEVYTVTELGKNMGLTKAALKRNLALLEELDFVGEVPFRLDDDLRCKRYFVTTTGEAMVRAVTPLWQAAQRSVGEAFEKRDYYHMMFLVGLIPGMIQNGEIK